MDLKPRSHSGEGAMMISANIDATSNSPEFAEKSGNVWSHDKRSSYFYNPSTMFYDAFQLS